MTQAAAGTIPDDALTVVLQLVDAARRAEKSPLWKTRTGDAIEVYGEACDALWTELYRLLDERNGSLPSKSQALPAPRKELKKQIVARLREELPSLVASVIDEF